MCVYVCILSRGLLIRKKMFDGLISFIFFLTDLRLAARKLRMICGAKIRMLSFQSVNIKESSAHPPT